MDISIYRSSINSFSLYFLDCLPLQTCVTSYKKSGLKQLILITFIVVFDNFWKTRVFVELNIFIYGSLSYGSHIMIIYQFGNYSALNVIGNFTTQSIQHDAHPSIFIWICDDKFYNGLTRVYFWIQILILFYFRRD